MSKDEVVIPVGNIVNIQVDPIPPTKYMFRDPIQEVSCKIDVKAEKQMLDAFLKSPMSVGTFGTSMSACLTYTIKEVTDPITGKIHKYHPGDRMELNKDVTDKMFEFAHAMIDLCSEDLKEKQDQLNLTVQPTPTNTNNYDKGFEEGYNQATEEVQEEMRIEIEQLKERILELEHGPK